MDLKIDHKNGKLVYTFPHRMDTATCMELEPEILPEIENFDNDVIFDLKDLEYIASAFLRICLMVFKKVGADRFSCIHASPAVKKIFKIASFDQAMKIE